MCGREGPGPSENQASLARAFFFFQRKFRNNNSKRLAIHKKNDTSPD